MNPYKNKYSVVAPFYDYYVDSVYDLNFWLKELRGETEVLELASGSGRVTLPLARAGVKVTALDISRELLQQLRDKSREQNLCIEIHEGDMRDFELHHQFPLIIIPFQSIQELTNPDDHLSCFKCVKKHLAPFGRFIVTTHQNTELKDLNVLKVVREFIIPHTKQRVVFSMGRGFDYSTGLGVANQFYEVYDEDGTFDSKIYFKKQLLHIQKR